MATRIVSIRLPEDELARIEERGKSPTEIIREAIRKAAWEAKVDAWAERMRTMKRLEMPPGSPSSTEMIRQMRDER